MTVLMSMMCREHDWETVRVPPWMGWWLPRLHMCLHDLTRYHEPTEQEKP